MTLAQRINSMKFEFQLKAGYVPTTLLLPRDPGTLKLFVEQFVDEEGVENTGSKPLVYHMLKTGEQQLTYCDMQVELHDRDNIGMQ